jgi:hypothetical protein
VKLKKKSLADNYQQLYIKFKQIEIKFAKDSINADKKLKKAFIAFKVRLNTMALEIQKLKNEKKLLNLQFADSLRFYIIKTIVMFDDFKALEIKANEYLDHLETHNVRIAGFQIQDGGSTPLHRQMQLKMEFTLDRVSRNYNVTSKPLEFEIQVQQIKNLKERKKDIGQDDFMYDATTMDKIRVIKMNPNDTSFSFVWECDASKDQFFDDDRHYIIYLTNTTNPDFRLPLGNAQIFNGKKVTFYQEPNLELKNPNLDKMISENRIITLCENKMEVEIANRVNFSDTHVVEIYLRGERQAHTMTLNNSNSKYIFDFDLGDNSIDVLVKSSGKAIPMNMSKKAIFFIAFHGDCVQEEYRKGKKIELFPDQRWSVKIDRSK